jgi:hypothetical protein
VRAAVVCMQAAPRRLLRRQTASAIAALWGPHAGMDSSEDADSLLLMDEEAPPPPPAPAPRPPALPANSPLNIMQQVRLLRCAHANCMRAPACVCGCLRVRAAGAHAVAARGGWPFLMRMKFDVCICVTPHSRFFILTRRNEGKHAWNVVTAETDVSLCCCVRRQQMQALEDVVTSQLPQYAKAAAEGTLQPEVRVCMMYGMPLMYGHMRHTTYRDLHLRTTYTYVLTIGNNLPNHAKAAADGTLQCVRTVCVRSTVGATCAVYLLWRHGHRP